MSKGEKVREEMMKRVHKRMKERKLRRTERQGKDGKEGKGKIKVSREGVSIERKEVERYRKKGEEARRHWNVWVKQ